MISFSDKVICSGDRTRVLYTLPFYSAIIYAMETKMDSFTKDHLLNWIATDVRNDEKWAFTSFAAVVLQDADDLAHYQDVGWQRLYDRFYDERIAS